MEAGGQTEGRYKATEKWESTLTWSVCWLSDAAASRWSRAPHPCALSKACCASRTRSSATLRPVFSATPSSSAAVSFSERRATSFACASRDSSVSVRARSVCPRETSSRQSAHLEEGRASEAGEGGACSLPGVGGSFDVPCGAARQSAPPASAPARLRGPAPPA